MEAISILTDAEADDVLARRGRAAFPAPPRTFLFPDTLLVRAGAHLRVNGARGCEQLVLWGGYPTDRGVVLASLLMPETEADWGWVTIPPPEQARIAPWLYRRGQLLFVESHTHGGRGGKRATEMSDTDRRYPASTVDGFLTVIVPSYAARGVRFREAGVWECRQGRWDRLPCGDVRRRVRVVSAKEARNAVFT